MAKILIVDDDTATATSIGHALQEAGHTWAVRNSGKDVLDLAKKEDLDLVVLDVMLPDVSGFEVCRRIRRDAELYTLPILILSAMTSPEEIQHGLAQGADDYVTKPFNASDLVRRIDALLSTLADVDYVDPVTDLPDTEGIRKRLQRLITRGGPFSLVSVEMLNLRIFSRDLGERARSKVLRHLARALTLYTEDFDPDETVVGHLGAGFYICAVPVGEAKAYCEKVQSGWRKHLRALYGSLDLSDQYEASRKGMVGMPGLLELLFCMTSREDDEPVSAQQMMDTLSRIRRTVGDVTVGGIHTDRRV